MLRKSKRTRDFVGFLTGMILIIWEINIYRKTIIPFWIPFIIIILIGAWKTWLNYKKYISTYKKEGGNLFFATLQYTVVWGFSLCSIFMISNYYLANSKKQIKNFTIEERSSLPGRKGDRGNRKPTFIINYEGLKKELVFSSSYYSKIDEYTEVTLLTQNGLFGFDIILDQNLY